MKVFQVIAFALIVALAACSGSPARPAGDWHGAIATPQGKLTVVVRIAMSGGAFTGTLESVDQAPGELTPITITAASPERLAFTIPSLNAAYASNWDASADAYAGTWVQSGYKFPLILRAGPAMATVTGMDGVWEAKVQRGATTRRLILRIATAGENTSIKFDAPDAGATNLQVANFSRQGDRIRFAVPAAGAEFDGTLAPSGDRIEGVWNFPGQPPTKIVFARTGTQARQAPRLRPQEPHPPFPYRVEEVRVANPLAPGVTLACTLTTPPGAGPFPAAALITGSGAQDRDEAIFGHKPFAVLADHLTRSGIAVLRCNDRGLAPSTGDFGTATSTDFAGDADAMAAFLAQRAEVEKDAIGLIGHSEGALVAPIAAGANKKIRYLVLLAGPGTNLRNMLLTQRRLIAAAQGIPEAAIAKPLALLARLYDAVAAANSDADAAARVDAILTPDAMAALGVSADAKGALVQQMASVWMRHFLRLDPASYLAKVEVPVLAMAGSLDTQVEPNGNLAGIKASLIHTKDVTVVKLDGLNHFFQHAKTGAPNEYVNIEETFAPTALDAISHWIQARFARRK